MQINIIVLSKVITIVTLNEGLRAWHKENSISQREFYLYILLSPQSAEIRMIILQRYTHDAHPRNEQIIIDLQHYASKGQKQNEVHVSCRTTHER